MILVTGGCGYIGSHVVKLLTENKEQCLVYDDLSQGTPQALLGKEKLIVGDIRDTVKLRQVFATHKISAVIHLAALVNAKESIKKAELYQAVNAQGSANVFAMAREFGVRHALYASSASVYGNTTRSALTEQSPCHPSNPYGETKLAGEIALQSTFTKASNYLIFRFFNVGGADPSGKLGQSQASHAIMQRAFASVKSGTELQVNGHDYNTKDGTVSRDFIHVLDIAQAFVMGLAYLERGGSSHVLNLGTGVPHTLGEVLSAIEHATGKTLRVKYGPKIKGDIIYSLADPALAQNVLGWSAKYTLADIVKDGWNAYVLRQA